MAVSPPGDIVMNVARAADPERVAAAQARLRALSNDKVAFSPTPVDGTASSKTDDTRVKFEAMVLQNFLGHLLPSENSAVYGEGVAGEMWCSLLAQQLSETLAERGGLGIADRVLKDFTLVNETKVPIGSVSSSPQQQEAATQALLSDALIDEIERRASRTLGSGGTSPLDDKQG